MPRLHTLYLPNGRRSTPFAFILDQINPMSIPAESAWRMFAERCGALDIMFTTDTIDIDPETSDGWQPEDEPVGYTPSDSHRCGEDCMPKVIGLPDLLSMVQAAHAAAWVPWEPANLDPESPKISTHHAESCAAVNNEATGCPMHAPILDGPWAAWPFFAANPADIGPTIVRICEHGISHPTPEEYLGGFDTPHLCDGCECAGQDVRDQFSIVVSDLANTKLPRGTLLLGTKEDPTPPVSGWVNRVPQCTKSSDRGRCLKSDSHDGDCAFPWTTAEVELTTFDRETGRDRIVDAGWVAPPETCLAGSETLRCTRPYGHEGLHDFGPFTRI